MKKNMKFKLTGIIKKSPVKRSQELIMLAQKLKEKSYRYLAKSKMQVDGNDRI